MGARRPILRLVPILAAALVPGSALANHESRVRDDHPTGGTPAPTNQETVVPTSWLTVGPECTSGTKQLPHLHGFHFGHWDSQLGPCGHGTGVPIADPPPPPPVGIVPVNGVLDDWFLHPGTPGSVNFYRYGTMSRGVIPSRDGSPGRFRIADNESPVPTDRVYFAYNYFTDALPGQGPPGPSTVTIPIPERIWFVDQSPNGNPFAPGGGLPGPTGVHVGGSAPRRFDTEMLQLDISGGSLPPGGRIRESPTPPRPPHWESFFDVFTEIDLPPRPPRDPTITIDPRTGSLGVVWSDVPDTGLGGAFGPGGGFDGTVPISDDPPVPPTGPAANPPGGGVTTTPAPTREFIRGANDFSTDERRRVERLLQGLPGYLGGMNMTFMRGGNNPMSPGGYEPDGGYMLLNDQFFEKTEEEQRKIVTHEFGHQWHDHNEGLVTGFMGIGWTVPEGTSFEGLGGPDRSGWQKPGATFPVRPGVDDQPGAQGASRNPQEDFGVSVEMFHTNPDELRRQSPERFNWLQQNLPGQGSPAGSGATPPGGGTTPPAGGSTPPGTGAAPGGIPHAGGGTFESTLPVAPRLRFSSHASDTTALPTGAGLPPGFSNENVLWGDYFYVNPGESFTQGETLVHIESDTSRPPPTPPTEPLPGGSGGGTSGGGGR